MQGTADVHDHIAPARLPQAVGVVDDAAALDAAVDVLEADAAACDPPLGRVLRPREGPAPGLFRGHDDFDLGERERQAAEILEQPAARGPGLGRRLCHPLVVRAAPVRVAQEEDRQHRMDQQHIVHGMACVLATRTARLLKRVLGALDAPFGPIRPNRGEGAAGGGAAAGGRAGGTGSAGGTTRVAAAAAVTPRRWANACTARQGASPRARRVAFRTTSRR